MKIILKFLYFVLLILVVEPIANALDIKSGSWVDATLVTGSPVPNDGQPVEYVFRITANEIRIGADTMKMPDGIFYLRTAAQGSSNDNRIHFRLIEVVTIADNHKLKKIKADGWIEDFTGIRGLVSEISEPPVSESCKPSESGLINIEPTFPPRKRDSEICKFENWQNSLKKDLMHLKHLIVPAETKAKVFFSMDITL